MDRETIGRISNLINNTFEKQNILETVNWILEADTFKVIESQEDLALGYILGAILNIGDCIVRDKKYDDTIVKWKKKMLEKMLEKEELKKMLDAQPKIGEQAKAKGGRIHYIKVETTEKETDRVRNMLIPMIAPYREKISKEKALKDSESK